MNIEEAFALIATRLQDASTRGITPVIRAAGTDWVCTLDDGRKKSILIAKERELILVDMESKKGEPVVQRVEAPETGQPYIVTRIQEAIREAYGALPGE